MGGSKIQAESCQWDEKDFPIAEKMATLTQVFCIFLPVFLSSLLFCVSVAILYSLLPGNHPCSP